MTEKYFIIETVTLSWIIEQLDNVYERYGWRWSSFERNSSMWSICKYNEVVDYIYYTHVVGGLLRSRCPADDTAHIKTHIHMVEKDGEGWGEGR